MELNDITKTGPLGYKDLLNENDNFFVSTNFPYDYVDMLNSNRGYNSYNSDILNFVPELSGEKNDFRNNLTDWRNDVLTSEVGDMSYRIAGREHSRFDDRINNDSDWYNIDNYRGTRLTGFNQIMSGLGKMATIALTTAADSFIGTAYGLVNVAVQDMKGNINSGKDVLDAFVDNPVSRYILSINDKAEEWMPNYYTDEERNSPWYQQFFHANFLGDHLLKNTGFMIGAYLGGKLSAGMLSKAFKTSEARNIFKDTALALGVEDATPKEVLNAYKTGKAIGTEKKVTQALADAAKNAKNADLNLKLASTAIGSVGEARMEAITNSDDWFERNKKAIDLRKALSIQNIDALIYDKNPDLFVFLQVTGPEGNVIGYQRVPKNTSAYNAEYNRTRRLIEDKYNQDLALLSQQRTDYANESFLINFALVYGENLNILGDAITGSWSKRAAFNQRLKNIAKKWKANPGSMAADVTEGFLRGPVFEGTQEMLQLGTVLHLNRKQGNLLNSYYGDVIDKDGLDVVSGGLNNFLASVKDTYADPDQWENFALGAITALLPLPTQVRTQQEVTDENGKKSTLVKSKWTVGGEFWSELRNANKNYKQSKELAMALNNIELDKDKLEKFYKLVKENNLGQIQQNALDNNDQKLFKDVEFDRIASSVITYAKAGLTDYLKRLIDEIYTIETPEQIENLRQINSYKETQKDGTEVVKSLFDTMSDDEIKDYYKDLKEKVLDKVERLTEIYNNINDLYGDFNGNDAYMTTLAHLIMTIDDREDRIKQLSAEKVEELKQYAQKFKAGIIEDELTVDQQRKLRRIEKQIQALLDIHDLNIATGDEGFLNELDKIRQDQLLSLDLKFNKINKLLQRSLKVADRKYQTGLSREEYDKFRRLRKNAKQRVSTRTLELFSILGDMASILRSISETTDGLNFEKKFEDLLRLLSERETLYDNLAVLSGENGEDIFNQGLSFDIANALGEYQTAYTRKYYDEFKNTHSLSGFSALRNIIREIAINEKDEDTLKYLDLYETYLYDNDSLAKSDLLDDNQKNEIIQNITEAIQESSNPEDAQKRIDDALDNKIQDEDSKKVIQQFKGNLKDKQERKLATKEGIKEDKEPELVEEKYAYEDTLKKMSKEDFDKAFSELNFLLSLREDRFDGLAVDVASRFGWQIDWGQSAEQYIEKTYNDNKKDSNTGNSYNDIKDELNNIYETVNETSGQEESVDEEKADNGEEVKPEENDKTTDSDTASSSNINAGDDIQDFQDNAPQQEYEGNNQQLMNPKNPQPIVKAAEESVEQKYDNNGSDVVEEDGVDVDAWNVNQMACLYMPDVLRNPEYRMLRLRDTGTASIDAFTIPLNEKFKILQFIDSGFLGMIVRLNKQIGIPKTKVHFVGINDGKYDFIDGKDMSLKIKDNLLQYTIFSAVEIPLQLLLEYQDAGYTLTLFTKPDGSKAYMQILGIVTPLITRDKNGKGSIYEQDDNGNDIWYKTKNGKNRKYKDKQFALFESKIIAERSKIKSEDDFIVYSLTSNIELIYPGRITKQINDVDGKTVKAKERPLGEILSDEEKNNPNGKLQLRLYLRGDVSRTVGQDLDGETIPLNILSLTGDIGTAIGRTRDGSVWIMTEEADGYVYHKGARIVTFSRSWYNANPNSQYANGIRKSIRQIIDNRNNLEGAKNAIHELRRYLYIPNGKKIDVVTTKGILFSGNKSVNLNMNSAEEDLLNLLIDNNYTFSIIGPSLKEIVDSNIITTDLATLHNKNASFIISRVVSQDEKMQPIESQFAKDYDIRSIANQKEPDSRNGQTYNVKTVDGQAVDYKLFDVGDRVESVGLKNEIKDSRILALLKECRNIESNRDKFTNPVFETMNGNKGTVHLIEYSDNGNKRILAFVYGGNRNVTILNNDLTTLINKIKNEGYAPDKNDTDILNSIYKLTGSSGKNNSKKQKLNDAVENGTGVKELESDDKTLHTQITPDYVNTYPELEPVLFKVGDDITYTYKLGDNIINVSGRVQKINKDGSIEIVNEDNVVQKIESDVVLNFFGKNDNTNSVFNILTKSNETQYNGKNILDKNDFVKLKDLIENKSKKNNLIFDESDIDKDDQLIAQNKEKVNVNQLINDIVTLELNGSDKLEKIKRLNNIYKQYGSNRKQVLDNIRNKDDETITNLKKAFDKIKEGSYSNEDFDDFLNKLDTAIKC